MQSVSILTQDTTDIKMEIITKEQRQKSLKTKFEIFSGPMCECNEAICLGFPKRIYIITK